MPEEKSIRDYEDIIHLPHHVSTKHPQMSLYDRAAQFAPFAALSGHSAAIAETARLTEQKAELDEDALEELNRKLQVLENHPGADVTITYFMEDARKEGGAYVSHTGVVKKIDGYVREIVMTDGTRIPIAQIREMDCL